MEKIDGRQGSLFFEILKVYEFLYPKEIWHGFRMEKNIFCGMIFGFHFKFQGCRVYTPKVKLGSEKLRPKRECRLATIIFQGLCHIQSEGNAYQIHRNQLLELD